LRTEVETRGADAAAQVRAAEQSLERELGAAGRSAEGALVGADGGTAPAAPADASIAGTREGEGVLRDASPQTEPAAAPQPQSDASAAAPMPALKESGV
jgi:hypothetical protein